ncbi:MAG: N-acetylmuramoyl-L-alanine amidase, partial [Bacteroidia bacterium]
DIASKIQAEYTKKAGRVDKGVQRQSIWVLWRTAMPSILTEVGFLTNPEEEKFLGSEKGQKYMASALFRAVRSYKDETEGVTKKYDDELEKEEPLVNENLSKGHTIDTDNEDEKDSTQVANAADEELYNGFIKEADDNFKLKKYEDALVKYEKCNELKPEERYPLARVEECKKKIAEQKNSVSAEEQQKKELKAKYNSFIASGDKLMTQKNWKAAAVQYQQASELMPDETYPKEKIKLADENIEADKKLAEEKAKIKTEKHKADSLLKIQKQATDTVPPKANDIVTNYKDKTPKKDTAHKAKSTNPPEGKQGIVFRVQFAMSETEPDVKSDKYKNADDVWYYKAGNVYKLTSGSFSTPDEVIKHQEKMRAAGYKDAFVVAFKNNQRIDFKEAVKQISK